MTQSITKILPAKRRHFQLLEVMVAVLLIMLCAVPSLQVYTNMYKQQAKVNVTYQRDHLARLAHARIIEKLSQNEIELDDIFHGTILQLSDADLSEKIGKIGYDLTYKLAVIRPKNESKWSTTKRFLCKLIIILSKKKDGENSLIRHKNDNKGSDQASGVTDYEYKVYIDRGEKIKLDSEKPRGDGPGGIHNDVYRSDGHGGGNGPGLRPNDGEEDDDSSDGSFDFDDGEDVEDDDDDDEEESDSDESQPSIPSPPPRKAESRSINKATVNKTTMKTKK